VIYASLEFIPIQKHFPLFSAAAKQWHNNMLQNEDTLSYSIKISAASLAPHLNH